MADLNHPEDIASAPGGPPELDALGRIELEAMGDEQERATAEEKILNPEPEPVIDPAQAWATMAKTVGGLLGMALPELRDVYTDAACLDWGRGMSLVADKYEWNADETMAKWAPECTLIMASIPLIVPTVFAIKERVAASKAKPINNPPSHDLNSVAGANNADAEEVKPMDMKPGGFSEPT